MARPNEVSLFCAYAHTDGKFREEFFRHLSLLKRAGIIRAWFDGQIVPGQQWREEIERELRSADVVLLLISVDFLASEFVLQHELPVALERQRAHKALVIPVLLRPVTWSLSGLDFLEALPSGLRPVVRWQPRDLAYVDVCEGMLKAILLWRKGKRVEAHAVSNAPATKRRVMDLGLPARVPVGLATVLAIMVRRPHSSGLAGLMDLKVRYGLETEDVESTQAFTVPFPRAADGSLQGVEFALTVESTDFTFVTASKPLLVPPRGDSEVCVFLLTAQRAGTLHLSVELTHSGRRVAACLLSAEGVNGVLYEPTVSSSITFKVNDSSAAPRGTRKGLRNPQRVRSGKKTKKKQDQPAAAERPSSQHPSPPRASWASPSPPAIRRDRH